MGFSWKSFRLARFYGTDLKNNVIDVKDGFSIDNENIYQRDDGVSSKRKGNEIMFNKDESSSAIEIDEIGSCRLNSTKYYFKFSDGKFSYSTSYNGTLTTISPSPAISTVNQIWYAVADNKLFFVDGTNALRYFDGSSVVASTIYARPTVAATGGAGTGFDFLYTVDNGLGESPIVITALSNKGSTSTVSIAGNTGPQTLVVGNKIRVYSRTTAIAASSVNVTTQSGSDANGTYGVDSLGGYYQITSTTATYSITTIAIVDGLVQLYSELGLALNKTAPTALEGITNHYGRLVGWKGSSVYNSKVSNAHSWPDNASSRGEVWQYSYFTGDGNSVKRCISFRESLYVLKPDNVAVFGGIGPDDSGGNPYSFRRLETNGNGCVAGKSAVVVGEDDKTALFYISRNGFYATDGQDPERIGDLIAPSVQALSAADLEATVAIHHKREGLYIAALGTELNRVIWVYDTREFDNAVVGWFKWVDLPIKCLAWDETEYMFGAYTGYCAKERNASTSLDYADAQAEFIADASFNTGTDVITVANTYANGDIIQFRSTGTLPTGITANTNYFVINATATTIKISATSGGAAVDISIAGSGTHSLISKAPIACFYTTNWFKFGSAGQVKKLGKLGVLLNATSTSINIAVSSAYDWVNQFEDEQPITVTSSHLWGDSLWGAFIWGSGSVAAIKNVAIAKRKCRSVRYKFSNATLNQDLDLLGIEQSFDVLRNRGAFA